MRSRTNNIFAHRGFTLLELTIAMFLVASLTVTLYESLRVANHARLSAEASVVQSSEFDLALNIMRADLENVPPTYGSQSGTASILANEFSDQLNSTSNGQTLDFYTCGDGLLKGAQTGQGQLPQQSSQQGPQQSLQQQTQAQQQQQQWNAASEIKQVEYALDVPAGSTQQCLVRRVWDNVQALAENQGDPREEIICRGVDQFSLRYFDGSAWQTSWDSSQLDYQMPEAVEVTLHLQAPPGSNQAPKSFVCVIPIACSNAANDPNVNSGIGGL